MKQYAFARQTKAPKAARKNDRKVSRLFSTFISRIQTATLGFRVTPTSINFGCFQRLLSILEQAEQESSSRLLDRIGYPARTLHRGFISYPRTRVKTSSRDARKKAPEVLKLVPYVGHCIISGFLLCQEEFAHLGGASTPECSVKHWPESAVCRGSNVGFRCLCLELIQSKCGMAILI